MVSGFLFADAGEDQKKGRTPEGPPRMTAFRMRNEYCAEIKDYGVFATTCALVVESSCWTKFGLWTP